jgi:hypothetical protein
MQIFSKIVVESILLRECDLSLMDWPGADLTKLFYSNQLFLQSNRTSDSPIKCAVPWLQGDQMSLRKKISPKYCSTHFLVKINAYLAKVAKKFELLLYLSKNYPKG